jgi:predicted secreted protein
MAVQNGTYFKLYYSTDDGSTWNAIAHGTDHTLEVTMDTREANTKDSGAERSFLSSYTSWSMSAEHLVDLEGTHNYDELFTLWKARTKFKVYMQGGTTESGYGGEVYITSLSLNMPMEDNTSCSVSLQGTGTLALLDNS